MKTTKLLTGAAAAALIAGVASAQSTDVTIDDINGDANAVFASERDLSAAPQDMTINGLDAAPSTSDVLAQLNALADTDNVDITISLSGDLSWNGNLNDSNYVGAAGTQCSVTISAGGANGGTSVTYTSDDANFEGANCTAGDLTFDLPITAEGPGNVSTLVELTATGTDLGGEAYDSTSATTGAQALVETASGYTTTFSTGGTDFLNLTDGYETFGTGAGGGVGSATVGTVTFAAEADVDFAATTSGFAAADTTDDGQIDGATATFSVEDATGLASFTFNSETVAINSTTGEASFDLTTGDMAGLAGGQDVVLNAATGADAAPISNQNISASFSVDVGASSDLTIADSSATHGILDRQGSTTGTFEWVGDSAASTSNIFRVTGLGATLPVIRVTLANSTADVDDEYVMTPTGTLTAGELIITTADIQSAVGSAFGRADITFSFEANGVTVRRFMVTNGVVSENSTDYSVGTDEIGG